MLTEMTTQTLASMELPQTVKLKHLINETPKVAA